MKNDSCKNSPNNKKIQKEENQVKTHDLRTNMFLFVCVCVQFCCYFIYF